MMDGKKRKPWTENDNESLIDYWGQVGSVVLIAMLLERTPSSVQTQASRLGLPRRSDGKKGNHRRRWTECDETRLEEAIKQFTDTKGKIPIKKISQKVGRSVDAIVAKLATMYEDEKCLIDRIILPPPESDTKKPSEKSLSKPQQKPKPVNGKAQMRPCMTCRKPFWSEGSHNRMCSRCRSGDVDYWDF